MTDVVAGRGALMTPENIDRVFGRGRLKMVTGEHVEVFREEALPGERRRYTKRFLSSMGGDFRQWTEREWRILARLVGHGIRPVPDVVQYDRGAGGRSALVQTYDAGITVDHWATLLPVERDGEPLRHVFEDCAHWWALALHSLVALDAIHGLQLVHLDLKADNVCIPCGPADFDPTRPGQVLHPLFDQIALIDFAFSLVSGEPLQAALPIGHQADYEYQSPRLLDALEAGRLGNLLPTRQLDWRCDVFSLAAMLRRYLPPLNASRRGQWTDQRLAAALSLIRRLVDAHDRAPPVQRPHKEWIELASRVLREKDLAASLARGWRLAQHAAVAADATRTPVTRIAPVIASIAHDAGPAFGPPPALAASAERHARTRRLLWLSCAAAAAALAVPWHVTAPERVARAPVPSPPAMPAAVVSAPQPEVVAPTQAASMPAAEPIADAANAASAPAAAKVAKMAGAAPVAAPAQPIVAAAAPAPTSLHRAVVRPPIALHSHAPKHVAASRGVPYLLPRSTISSSPPFALAAGPVHSHAASRTGALGPAPAAPPAVAAAAAASPAPPPTVAIATLPAPAPVTEASSAQVEERPVPAPALPDDFAMRASVLMTDHLPRLAQRVEPRMLRTLHVAAQAENPSQQAEVAESARALRLASSDTLPEVATAGMDARLLNDAAEAAFWNAHNVQQALSLQTRAFGAQPHDELIAGNLAYYQLKQRPARAEPARQLALYALTMSDPHYPQGRIEDWTNFAIASALVGRERDARNALFVTLALSPSVDRQCRSALAAVASHGERLRGPVEAMLARIRTWGRSQESPFCRWPPSWWEGERREGERISFRDR
jgi:hypothetical protein